MEIGVLADQNPWWKDKERIENDFHIEKWKEKKYKWMPPLVEKIKTKPFSLHILLGPRQVGKTTAVKLLIKKLLKTQDAKKIFYFNCEEIADYKELLDLIKTYLSLRNDWNVDGSYLFFDEITSPTDWYKAVKSLIDKGKFKNDVVLLTGSSSIQVKKQAELFPGRRGHGENFMLLPLSFREFLKLHKPDIFEKVDSLKSLESRVIEKNASNGMLFLPELNSLFEKYLKQGGFPLSIEFGKDQHVKRDYLSWIKTEILKDGRSDAIARQILKVLLEKMPSPISWESISREIEIKSPKTVSAYVHLLQEIFSLLVLQHVDISAKTVKFGKNKKIHVLDPLLFEVFQDWAMVKLQDKKSTLVESVVATHVARFISKKTKSTVLDENIFYWRNKSEVDVVADYKGMNGIEVKWSDNFARKKISHLKNFILLSKTKFRKGKPLVVPVSIFLAMLEA